MLIRVDGCEIYCGVCGCRLSVYVYFYVSASSGDCEVEKISGTIAEVFLQHLEHIYIRPHKETKSILFYTRYIDDILIIYDTESTNHDYLTQYTNTMHTNLQFNPTLESNSYINLSRPHNHQKKHTFLLLSFHSGWHVICYSKYILISFPASSKICCEMAFLEVCIT